MRIEKDQIRTLMILGAMAVIFGLVMWLPLHLKTTQLKERIAKAEKQLGMDRASTAGLGKLANEVIRLEQVVSGAQKHVPRQADLAPFLRDLSTELNALEVTEREVETLPIAEGAHYSIVPVNLQFHSDFPEAYQFLKRIESKRRLIRVNRLEIDGRRDGPAQQHAVRIELATFFSRPHEGVDDDG